MCDNCVSFCFQTHHLQMLIQTCYFLLMDDIIFDASTKKFALVNKWTFEEHIFGSIAQKHQIFCDSCRFEYRTHININPNEIIYYFGTSKWTREIAHEHSIDAMPRNRQTWNARNQEPNIYHALVDSVFCWLYARELKRGKKRWFGNILGKRSLLWNGTKKKTRKKNPAFNLRQHYTLVIASS